MTGYELSRAYFDWSWDNPEFRTTNMTALYMWFIEKWNRCGQPQKFSVTASESMDCLGMKSRNTYSETFNKLVVHGFIKVVVKSTNQYNCNVIMLTQKMSNHKDTKRTALDKALIQQVSKQEDSTDTISKQVNKETSKPITQNESVIFTSFNLWIDENAKLIRKIKTQLTSKELETLLESNSRDAIKDTILALANYKGAETKYSSVYLTLLNWLKKRKEDKKPLTMTPKYTTLEDLNKPLA